ncbi:hypothetical protein DMN91_008215 [Ooceraea biroi]|uniref:JmjC domain-containing protein n=1 Tax=Ooceraea biroi TaxID=2015173 RepID=A0A3L8DIJ0_OOCBI|nr:hypothetical protein DMN91_008215 [Ooceraea biroi]
MVDNARVITVHWELLREEIERIPVEIKLHLAPIISVLRTSDEKLASAGWIGASLTRVDACLDRAWETLNTGHWKDVPIENRYCYSLCTVIKAVLLELRCINNTESTNEEQKNTIFKDILDQIDKGLLLGAPLPSGPDAHCLLTSIAASLNRYLAEKSAVELGEISADYKGTDRMVSYPNRHFEQPSMEEFNEKIFQDLDYLYRTMGFRTVPIEIGSSYTEDDWTQRLLNFSDFLQEYIIADSSEIGYLAQHQLFEQVPELKEDFEVPLYCFFSDDPSEESTTHHVNCWLGPANTVSPLHYDRYNNLLCQVFGYKRIILYPPDESGYLYPHESRLLENTAQVDPLEPDYDKWPNFRKANQMTFYLRPGEMLYIPPKWWHHVTALTPSFSVSFWWT